MTNYLEQSIIDKAYLQNKWLGGRIRTLSKFAVSGTQEKRDYHELCHFLDQEGVAYDTNGDSLVWLGALDYSIAKLLKQTKTK